MKKHWGWLVVLIFCFSLYWPFWLKGLIPAPFDTLVGAYYPWLSYKWGTLVGVPVKNALLSDSFSQFYIWKYLSIDQLKSFHFPVWNPYVFSGTYLMATFHSAAIFPGNILLFLPRPWSWGFFIFASTLISAFSMYLFLSKTTKNSFSRIVGAALYATAGPMTTWVEFGTAVWAMSLVPILFLLPLLPIRRLYFICFSVLIAVLFFAGHVQIITYTLPLLIFWLLINHSNPKYFLGLVLGILISAIQLIPTISLYKNSIRSQENYSATFNYGLSPARELIRLFVPDFFGHPVTGNHWDKDISYHEYSSFLGTVSVLIILSYIFFGQKNKIDKFWIFLFIGSLLLLINNPFSRWLFSLPLPLLTYSSASRMLFITLFSGSVLLARGFSNLNNLYKLSWILNSLILLALLLVPIQYFKISFRNSLVPIVLILVTPQITKFKQFRGLILTLLILIDLGRYFLKYNPFVSPDYVFPNTPIIQYLKNNLGDYRFFRQKTNLLPLNTWTPYGLRSVEGYDPLHLLSYHQQFHLLNNKPINDKVSRYAELEDINLDLVNRYSLKYYLNLDNSEDRILVKLKRANWNKVFSDPPVSIYQNPNLLLPVSDLNTVPFENLFGAVVSLLGLLLSLKIFIPPQRVY